jgi:hypothetical protein
MSIRIIFLVAELNINTIILKNTFGVGGGRVVKGKKK